MTVALLLVAGCSDYSLFGRKDRDATDTAVPYWTDTDRLLDTGPNTCPDVLALDTAVSTDEACLSVPVTGTLDTVVEWALSDGLNEYGHVLMAPAVGPLFDGDGDGDIDAADPPTVVVVTDDGGADANNTHGVLRLVDGRDGTLLASVSLLMWDTTQVFPYRYSNVALGDIDGDGAAEIVAVTTVVSGVPPEDPGPGEDTAPPDTGGGGGGDDTGIVVRPAPPGPDVPPGPEAEAGPCRVAAYTPDGTLRWLAEDTPIECGGHAPALADLDGDGAVEVIVGSGVYDGATGALRWQGRGGGRPPRFMEAGWMAFAVDLDGDGRQEVVTGEAIYDADGAVVCETGQPDGFPAAADLDGDGRGELVVVSNGWLRAFDAACNQRMETALGSDGIGGPPTLGDLDADGLPEIGVASATAYAAFEADGTLIWSAPVSDASSSTTGATFFDFDQDGVLEVVYADEVALWVFDGATGAVRILDDTHSSRTLHELPVVVDVDGDGLTEIVVPNGGTHSDAEAVGLYVLGSADGSWPANRRVWNQHAYSVTNVGDDLSIPVSPTPNWPTYNTFRSGVVDPVRGGAAPDAVPLGEVCINECDTDTWIADVRIGNEGLVGLRGSIPVSLYAAGTLVETRWTGPVIGSGGVSETLRFTLPAASAVDVRVVVDDDGAGAGRVVECLETNNVLALGGCE